MRSPDTEQDQAGTRPAGRVLTLWLVWAGGAGLFAWFLRLRSEPDVDLWLHLRIGAALRGGERFSALPDPLTALADRPYVPTQWLAQVAGSMVEGTLGLTGLHLLRALAVVAICGLAYAATRAWTSPATAATVAVLVTLATSAGWGERPQLLGLVFQALALACWSRTLRDGRPRWSLVPLSWVWSMAHGSWLIGAVTGAVVLVALRLSRERATVRWRELFALEALVCVVPALTPLGPRLLLEPLHVGATARATVNEWQAPSPTNPLLVIVVLLATVCLIRSVRSRDAATAVLALAGAALAVSAVRTIAVGALFLAPALGRALVRRPVPDRSPAEWVPTLAAAVVFLVVPGVVRGAPAEGPLDPPVDRAVAALPEGSRVAVDASASGWVLWTHPQVLPLRDLRVEAYSPQVAREYERFFRAEPGWQAYADRHDVAALLVRAGEPLDDAARGDGRWSAAARDDRFVLWTRSG